MIDKKTILKAIIISKYNGNIEEARPHEQEIIKQVSEIQKLLEEQQKLYETVSIQNTINNKLNINRESENIIFNKGTLVHCTGECSYEKLCEIKDKGIMSGDFIGVPEMNNAETFFCADFYRADKDITSEEFFARIQDSDSWSCRGPFSDMWKNSMKMAFIINPNQDLDSLTNTDMYRDENSENTMQNVLNLLPDYKNEKNGQVAAIPYGIPSNTFSGIVVGDFLLQNEQYMNIVRDLFPNLYIISHNGKIFFDPSLSKEVNESKKEECLATLPKFNDRVDMANRRIKKYLQNAPKQGEKMIFSEQEIGKDIISVLREAKINAENQYLKDEQNIFKGDEQESQLK